jgi:hypothetical protein
MNNIKGVKEKRGVSKVILVKNEDVPKKYSISEGDRGVVSIQTDKDSLPSNNDAIINHGLRTLI